MNDFKNGVVVRVDNGPRPPRALSGFTALNFCRIASLASNAAAAAVPSGWVTFKTCHPTFPVSQLQFSRWIVKLGERDTAAAAFERVCVERSGAESFPLSWTRQKISCSGNELMMLLLLLPLNLYFKIRSPRPQPLFHVGKPVVLRCCSGKC